MVFVYLLDDHPRYVELSAVVLSAVESGRLEGITTTVTLAELLTAPAQAGDERALRDYELYLTHFPHLTILPLDVGLARLAARTRVQSGLPLPDAVQVAAASHAGCDVIVSNDRRWRGKTGPLELVLLDEFAAQ
jgi:predicted nucleic acid-binding protein